MKTAILIIILIPHLLLISMQNDTNTTYEWRRPSEINNDSTKKYAITAGFAGCYEKEEMYSPTVVNHLYGISSQISFEIYFDKSNNWSIEFNHFYFKHFNEKTKIVNSGNLLSMVLKYNIGNVEKNNFLASFFLGGLPFPPRGFDIGLNFKYRLFNYIFLESSIRSISNIRMTTLESTEPIFGIDYTPTMITFGLTYVL